MFMFPYIHTVVVTTHCKCIGIDCITYFDQKFELESYNNTQWASSSTTSSIKWR